MHFAGSRVAAGLNPIITMYSAIQRLNTLSTFYSSALVVTLILLGLSNFFMPVQQPNVNITVNKVALRRGTEDYYVNKSTWLADLSLDIEADFHGLFHWNTKLLFVYLVMEYATPKAPRNELVIWDKIIEAKDFHRLDLHGIRAKYPPCDIHDKLPGTEAKLRMRWNTVPWVGLLTDTTKGEATFTVPS